MAEQQPTSTDRQSGHSISPSPLFNPTSPATVSTSAGRDLLVGGVCAEVNLMYDINGERGLFFAFPDLSIRVSGRFRIRFTLFDLKATCPFSLAHAVIVSDCFSVFHPKDFPGMASSTDLSRCLARQGLRIHIRSSQSEHLDGGVGDKGKKRKDVVQDAGSAKKRGRTVKEARDVVGREVQNEGAAGEGDDDGDVVPVIPARALA
ncbi:velvet factor-domain-containing protein [Chytridium lagenaria]|nr:velvet factor-domain-containing protein [Chytridium lagenaria]